MTARSHPSGRLRSSSRTMLVAAMLFAGAAVTAAASAALTSADPASSVTGSAEVTSQAGAAEAHSTPEAAEALGTDGTAILAAEIEALLAGGVAPDDPKVTRLQEDLAALVVDPTALPPREPGVDLTDVLGGRGGGARSAGDRTDADVAWDHGAVECEPLPADILPIGDLADARCVMAPQPDGTGRYVAVTPDGTLRVVQFGPDGAVARQPDRRTEPLGGELHAAELGVDESGDVIVSVAGASAPTIIELD
ncbi:MAG: hypothetical protein ACRD2C_16640 [Acidimicrobiales bacterium]